VESRSGLQVAVLTQPVSYMYLKGLSGEMEGGSQVVSVDRYYLRNLQMGLLF
jgi:hypothetical protein